MRSGNLSDSPKRTRPKNYRGEPQIVQIEALTQDGRGVCRVDGKAVFVSDALPGEKVRMQPLKQRKGHDEAELLEVLIPSPQRVEPRCTYFGLCGGCALQHLDHAGQLAAKQDQLLAAFERIGKVEPAVVRPAVAGDAWAYRRRARLGVRWVRAKQRVLVGFRERAGSYLADMAHCEVLAEPCRELPGLLAELIGNLSIKARLPQVEMTVADNGVALVFRVLDPPTQDDLLAMGEFAAKHGFRVYLQPAGLDSIELLAGDSEGLYYSLDDWAVKIFFEPSDFIQINAGLNKKMVALAIEELSLETGHEVLDLFCGLGNFSLPAAKSAARVTGIEGDAALVSRARENARINAVDNVEYQVSNLFDDVADFPWSRQKFDRVLLDPPRAGAREIIARMPKFGAQRIVYISCHPGTLARDAGLLVEQGFTLSSAGIMDMFPHTAHVESLAVFDRR